MQRVRIGEDHELAGWHRDDVPLTVDGVSHEQVAREDEAPCIVVLYVDCGKSAYRNEKGYEQEETPHESPPG